MKRRAWADECEARDAITRLAARSPLYGLDVEWTGERTSEAFAVERKYPNGYLVGQGYPDRFWIYTDGRPTVALPIR